MAGYFHGGCRWLCYRATDLGRTNPGDMVNLMRYRLRTLLIVLALGPPAIAGGYWAWKEWTKPPGWAGMLVPGEAYGFSNPLPGTTPTIVK